MRIDSQDLLGLPVVTERGMRLGKVLSFEIDVESHAVTRYRVGARHWPGGARHEISPAQVVSITAERMSVRDAAVADEEPSVSRSAAAPVRTISPLATTTRE